MKWISVKDRLPEINQECLIFVFGTIQKALFKGRTEQTNMDGYFWFAEDLDNWPHKDITHWMPLPEPPKQ